MIRQELKSKEAATAWDDPTISCWSFCYCGALHYYVFFRWLLVLMDDPEVRQILCYSCRVFMIASYHHMFHQRNVHWMQYLVDSLGPCNRFFGVWDLIWQDPPSTRPGHKTQILCNWMLPAGTCRFHAKAQAATNAASWCSANLTPQGAMEINTGEGWTPRYEQHIMENINI